MLYGHDIAAIPRLAKSFIGRTLPDAVVQPHDEDELIDLVRWASVHRIPLTPRGKATSVYGGAIPLQRGLVVDFHRMNKVVHIDPKTVTAVVEAGVVWEQLDHALQEHGLTLRLYPTSYPSSTVGGWLAQGGVGIGSFEAGWFRDSIVSARLVAPPGTVQEVAGTELDLVSDAEGITGLISQVTIRVQPRRELEVAAIAIPEATGLQQLAEAIIVKALPIWSLVFIDPKMAELKSMAPLMEHHGYPMEQRIQLPRQYLAVFAFRRDDHDVVDGKLRELGRAVGGEFLAPHVAQHEWEDRFRLMKVKRLGPSLVPSDVVVPLSELGSTLDELSRKIRQPLVMRGVVVTCGRDGSPEVALLGFIPHDQRRKGYHLVCGLALSMIKIAERHGGRAYGTGMYFKHKARQILGADRVARLARFKRFTDSDVIMNPGKVLGDGLLGRLVQLGERLEILGRWAGNHVPTELGERPAEDVHGIPADVAWYAYACSQCGYCVDECDQFYGRGWESQSPRGKWYWLQEYLEGRAKLDQFMVDAFLACTTCELCNVRCSAALPIEAAWMKLRGKFINQDRRMTFPPFEIMQAALQAEGDIWLGYRRNRADWFPPNLSEKHGPHHKSKNVYIAGCTASYVEQDVAVATVCLLDEAGVDFTYLGHRENCCATPMLVAGKFDTFLEIMRQNIKAVKDTGADTVISSCPACDMMWRNVYPAWAEKLAIDYGITAKHYSELVSEKIAAGEFKFPRRIRSHGQSVTVTWHDSCHLGRASGVYEPPRDIITAIPGVDLVEMRHTRENAHCCGSMISLISDPQVAHDVGKVRLDEAVEVGAKKVLSLCPCCEFQLRVSAEKCNIPIEVVDLAHFAAERLGYELPDPHPDVRAQWAVFEKMIALMTPRGLAGLMQAMWPELLDAMPLGTGRVMRLAAKIPGSLVVIRPLVPALLPRLLPSMMRNMLPTMLERVRERIPMPAYMAEQLPTLMPKVIDNLMPHMSREIAPLVSQPLIDHLRGEDASARN
jgi:Fe-S oxidoreductase/FAD/FMN-containing dehydrogenase